MSQIPDIVPVSDLRQDAAGVLNRVRKSRQPVVITQRGRAAVVMLSLEEYERSEEERRILHLLARGEKEIEAGSGHSLDDVMRDADAFLADLDR